MEEALEPAVAWRAWRHVKCRVYRVCPALRVRPHRTGAEERPDGVKIAGNKPPKSPQPTL
jgi:hypothetical protein